MSFRILRNLSWLCLALGLVTAASSIALVVLGSSPLPFGDQWHNIVSGKTHDLRWFFALHNEHRLALPRVAFLLDYALDAERNRLDLALNVALLSGTAALLFDLARRAGLARDRIGVLTWAGLALGLFSGIQTENLIWGFQVQFYGVCLLAVAAFSVLALCRAPRVALACTVLLAAAASCTLSAGLLVGIVATGLAAWLGCSRRHVLALAAAEAAILLGYLAGYRTPVQTSSPTEALGHPGAVVAYALTEIGGPVSTLLFASGGTAQSIAAAAGVGGLALLAIQGARLWRGVPRDPVAGVLLATAVFCAAVAGLTALGRWRFGDGQALAGRYQTPMLLFWFCVIALWASGGLRSGSRSDLGLGSETLPGPRDGLAVPLIAAVLALVAVNQPRYLLFALRVEALEAAASPAILAGVADPKALSILSDRPPDAVLAEAEALRQAGTSVFTRAWAGWMDRALHDLGVPASLPRCAGTFEAVAPVGTGARAGWSALGRLAGTGRFRGRTEIVLAGSDGRVAGYGVAGLSAVAAGAPGPRTAVDGDFWRGAFKAASPDGVVAYALDPAGHAACAMEQAQPADRAALRLTVPAAVPANAAGNRSG